jgi:tetratricopeptide (TPR) repeat protein
MLKRTNFSKAASRQVIRSVLGVAGLLVCLCGISSATRFGLSRLLSDYGSATSQLVAVNLAVGWSSSDAEAHYARATVLSDMNRGEEALIDFESAVALRPRDYYLWLELGHAREETGDREGALRAFEEAVNLAPDYSQPHWQLGNFLLRTGDFEKSFVELRRAAVSDVTLFPALMDLAWGTYEGNTKTVLTVIQPQTDVARLALARFFATHHEANEAINLLRTTSRSVGNEDRRAIVNELLVAKKFREAYEAWSAGLSPVGGDGNIVLDGGFEKAINTEEAGFGWKPVSGMQTVRLGLDANEPHSGMHCLRLEYAGDFEPLAPVISQLALVKPHTRYRLGFAARVEDLVTGGLPVVTVRDVDDHLVLAQTNSLSPGTSGWQDYSMLFETSATTHAVLIIIHRLNCPAAPCPIFGRAWFDDFVLREL